MISALLTTRKARTSCAAPMAGTQTPSRAWNTSLSRKGWESWGCAQEKTPERRSSGLSGAYQNDGDRPWNRACRHQTRSKGLALTRDDIQASYKEDTIYHDGPKNSNTLLRETGDAPSLETFQVRLLMAHRHLLWWKVALLSAGQPEHIKLSKSLSTQPKPSCGSRKHTHSTEPLDHATVDYSGLFRHFSQQLSRCAA